MKSTNRFRIESYWNVLIGQVILLIIASFMQEDLVLYILFSLAMLWIFGSVIMSSWVSELKRFLAMIFGIVALSAGLLWAVPGISDAVLRVAFIVCAFSYATFILIAISAMGHNVFVTDKVTTNRIVGSVCIYLLIGMFFAFMFTGLDIIDPKSFNFGLFTEPRLQEFREYLYFSYTTLTTLGYGDMLPQMPIARLLTSFEAVVGPVYLAIVVARLVGMSITQSMKK